MKRKNVKILPIILTLCIMVMLIPLVTLPVQAAEAYDYVITANEDWGYNVYRSEKDQNNFSLFLTKQPLNTTMRDISDAVGAGSTTIWFGESMSGTTTDTITNKLQLEDDMIQLGSYETSGGTYTLKGSCSSNSSGSTAVVVGHASVIVDGAEIKNYDGMVFCNGGGGSASNASNGTITVQANSLIWSSKSHAIKNINAGNIIINGGTVTSSSDVNSIHNLGSGNVTINGGTVSCPRGDAIYNEGTGNITINDGDVTGDNAIYNYNNGRITVNGGTVSGASTDVTAGYAIYNNLRGEIFINGGTVVSSTEHNQTILLKDGTSNVCVLTIAGGTVENTGDCTVIQNEGTGDILISDGTVTTSGTSAYGVKNNSTGKIYLAYTPSINGGSKDIYTSSSGTIVAKDLDLEDPYTGSEISVDYDGNITSDGTTVVVSNVTENTNDDLFVCEMSGYVFTLNGSDLVIYKPDYDYVITSGSEAYDLSCSDKGQDNFSIYKSNITFSQAINEITSLVGSDSTTIWFGDSMSGTSVNTLSSEALDIQSGQLYIGSNGTYTIKGNITNGSSSMLYTNGASIIVDDANLSAKGVISNSGGTVTIESGSTLTSTESYTINNSSGGEIIINGGTIESQGEGFSAVRNNQIMGGNVIINGGTITASNDAYGVENKNSGAIYLSSTPQITGSKAGIYAKYTNDIIANDGIVNTYYTGDAISVYIENCNVGSVAVKGLNNNGDKFTCANDGYFFKLDGTNLVIDAMPATEITSASITRITPPLAGATPSEYASLTAEDLSYTITGLTWLNSDGSTSATLTEAGKFKAEMVYKAQIELTSADTYKFQSEGLTPTVDVGTASAGTVSGGDVSGNKLTFIVTFNETEAKSVTAIEVKTQPTKLTYAEGENLDLSGLVVTLTYNDGSTEDIALVDFAANSITASPTDGTMLSMAGYNGQAVTLTCNSHEATTDTLTVGAAPDITAPSLTAGAVTRTSDTEGTVKFTSDEAGSYYYEVVADGAGEPVIDTGGAGVACTTAETTITDPTGLTAGAKDIYIKVKDASGNVSTVLKIDIAAYISSESGSNDGNSSSGTTTQPKQDSVIVIVNGKEQDAGKESKTTEDGKSTVTVEVDNEVIERKIDEEIKNNTTGNENIIQVPVVDTVSEVVKVELTGDIVKKLEENNFDVSVKRDNVEYIIPAEEFTISKVAENLGVTETDLVDIKVEVKITKLDEKVIEKYNEVANANGAELVFSPVSFEVMAKTTKADGSTGAVGISKFNNYVERVMEVPEGVDPSTITTGIVFNPDGTYSHVPTSVYQKDGKWYASLNSLTNSNYSVIWNPITVKSVENHWAKDAVNDMASRIIIFEPEKFEPNKAITRADFAEYIVRALGLYREGTMHENKFKDVTTTDDRTLAILIASEYGIVSGYPDGSFRPEDLTTREEAMAMYQRAMKVTKLTGNDLNRYQNYKDFKEVSQWAEACVKEVLSAHVFNGTSTSTISPKSNLTYAEAAQAIKNLLVESKLINN